MSSSIAMSLRSRYPHVTAALLLGCLLSCSFVSSEARVRVLTQDVVAPDADTAAAVVASDADTAAAVVAPDADTAAAVVAPDVDTAATVVAPDADTAAAEWPAAFPPGLWLTSVVKSAGPEYAMLQGKTGMLFSHADVQEHLFYLFSSVEPSEIESASVHTLGEVETREDGSAAVFTKATVSMGTPIGKIMSTDRCLTVVCDESDKNTVYILVKNNVASIKDCPGTPTPADFANDGAKLDMAALKADGAAIAKRSGDDHSATWPDDLPGLWRGELLGIDVEGVEDDTPLQFVASFQQGCAPNAWLFIDPSSPTTVIAANIGHFAGEAESADGGRAWRNDAYKWMSPKIDVSNAFDGYANWCNSIELSDDGSEMVILSAETAPMEKAIEDAEAETLLKELPDLGVAKCPKSPGKMLGETQLQLTTALLAETGAVSVGRMTKLG